MIINTQAEHVPAGTQQESAHSTSVKAAWGSFIGTTIEWYDYFIYGTAAAIVFPKVFFSNLSPEMATLMSMISFSVAFAVRPIGGLVIGHFGDRMGRKKLLVFTLMLMGLCTAGIGFLPTYEQAGFWAPALLILLRIIQGFALGGEWGGAALMSVEHAPPGRRGLWGATMQMGVPAGLLVSAGAFALVSSLPDEQFFGWAWRLPFIASLLLLVIGMYIRLQVSEPPAFEKVSKSGQTENMPLLSVLKFEKKKTVIMAFLQSAANVGYFLITVYSLTYITGTLGLPRSVATTALLVGASVDLLMQPIFGMLSDRYGRKKVYGFGALFFAFYAFPFFALLNTGDPVWITLALTLGLGIGHASTGSLHGVVYAEQYPTKYRFSGASAAYQLAGIVSSAPTPIIAAWLVATTGNSMAVSWFVVASAAITLLCLFSIKETYKVDINE
ncbi:MFS transporter [Pseudomonas sp. Pseusp16]|uniref:MFS transporter n=1 Tax=Pseudomonas sp. Pseusp16 TaxID=3243021 RepID=UPI0039B3C8EE